MRYQIPLFAVLIFLSCNKTEEIWKLISYETVGANNSLVLINSRETYTIQFLENQVIKGYDNCDTFYVKYISSENDSIQIFFLSTSRLGCPEKVKTFSIANPILNAFQIKDYYNQLDIYYHDSTLNNDSSTTIVNKILHFKN